MYEVHSVGLRGGCKADCPCLAGIPAHSAVLVLVLLRWYRMLLTWSEESHTMIANKTTAEPHVSGLQTYNATTFMELYT